MSNSVKEPVYFQCSRPEIQPLYYGENSRQISFPVSYTYNGGIVIGDKWYKGFHVPAPIIPSDCELNTLGIGLCLMSQPPMCTVLLKRKRSAQ
jgi:hypothetical protein